jgi:hypothetical protein
LLQSVAAVSASDAWAVGSEVAPDTVLTLIEHWNGKAWKRMLSPTPGPAPGSSFPSGVLLGFAATSRRNAWAVGDDDASQGTLIEHWNGSNWSRVHVPGLNTGQQTLSSVAASANAKRIWAVGSHTRRSLTVYHC